MIFVRSFLWTGPLLPYFQSYGKAPSFKAASNIIFKANANDSPHICIIFIKVLSHPSDKFRSRDLIIGVSFSLILNEFRRVITLKLMSDNTLKVGTVVHELNRLVFSLKSGATLPLWKIGGLLDIFLLLGNQLRIDLLRFWCSWWVI